MFQWNSEQYTKFEKERTQPSIDLINRLDIQPKTVLDIGCGPGNSTNQLYERFPDANILGIDNSDNMLCKARNSYPQLRFVNCFIPDELDRLDSFDLIFSNACLHWIPEHSSLYGRLMSCLNEGGVLAVQMPLVQYAPFYKILNELVAEKNGKVCGVYKTFTIFSPMIPMMHLPPFRTILRCGIRHIIISLTHIRRS